MYHVSAQGVDERMINVHYYYYYHQHHHKKKKKKVIRLESEECVDCFISAFQVVRSQHKLEWNAALHLMSAGGMEVLDPVHSYHLFQQKKLFNDIRNFFDFCAVGQRTSRTSWSPCCDRGSWYERCRVSSGQRSVTG